MFDPTIGRWLEEDPIGFAGGDANLYRMAGNNALNATDRNGLQATTPKTIDIPQEVIEEVERLWRNGFLNAKPKPELDELGATIVKDKSGKLRFLPVKGQGLSIKVKDYPTPEKDQMVIGTIHTHPVTDENAKVINARLHTDEKLKAASVVYDPNKSAPSRDDILNLFISNRDLMNHPALVGTYHFVISRDSLYVLYIFNKEKRGEELAQGVLKRYDDIYDPVDGSGKTLYQHLGEEAAVAALNGTGVALYKAIKKPTDRFFPTSASLVNFKKN